MKLKISLLLLCQIWAACSSLKIHPNGSIKPLWAWQGIEVIGNRRIDTENIRAWIPIKSGDLYRKDATVWEGWCERVRDRLKNDSVFCFPLFYPNLDVYLVIDVVEPEFQHRNIFRSPPVKNITLANTEILDLYDKLEKRFMELFSQGTPPMETWQEGYLDFSDPQMHGYAKKLFEIVPPYRENLFRVLAQDADPAKRGKAASLLNWSKECLSDSTVRSSRHLDDPSSLVRNNISRFTLHFLDRVKRTKDRVLIIDALLLQLDRPSFGDRNKAIYNLLSLAEMDPRNRAFIAKKGEALIRSLAETSVLPNIKDPANKLLQLITTRDSKI